MESYLHDREIVDDFLGEAGEHLDNVADLALAAEEGDPDAWAALRREVHTIKGAAGFLGLDAFSELCHELEEFLLREAGSADVSGRFDVVHESCDVLRNWLTEVERCCNERASFQDRGLANELLTRLR